MQVVKSRAIKYCFSAVSNFNKLCNVPRKTMTS